MQRELPLRVSSYIVFLIRPQEPDGSGVLEVTTPSRNIETGVVGEVVSRVPDMEVPPVAPADTIYGSI